MNPLIINAAVTGSVLTKSDNPDLPVKPDEIIADVRRCRDAGATIVHLHARDEHGAPSYKKEIYSEIFSGVRSECPDVLISASCSGRVHGEFWQRSEVLDLQPDFASLTLGSLNFPGRASVTSPQMIQSLALAMKERGIMPELQIFDLGMAEVTHYLIRKEVLCPPLYANILLGSLGALGATPDNLSAMVHALPPGTIWSAAGIGRYQFFINSLAITMGGHVRVGLEDAHYYDWGKKCLATNASLIDRVVRLSHAAQRPIATYEQTCRIIGVHQQPALTLCCAA